VSHTDFDAFVDFVHEQFPGFDTSELDLTDAYDKLLLSEHGVAHPFFNSVPEGSWLRVALWGQANCGDEKARLRALLEKEFWRTS
jgi:hypothetical protein